MNEKKITQVINYKTDADGHHLSMTACPYWRMNHHGITDGAKYVGTMDCEGCRWYCSKDVEARTIECAIPSKLAARYEREHSRMLRQQKQMRKQIKLSLMRQAEEESHRSGEIGSPTTLPATVSRVNEMKALTRQVCNYRVNTWSNNRDGHRHTQVGSLYMERTSKGRGYYAQRWVAELNISGCRYRMRSHSYEKCWAWIQNIREIYRLVFRRFAYIKSPQSLALLVVEHLATVGILPTRMNGALRSVTSRERAQEAYKRAMSVYKVSHKKEEEEA